MNSTKYLITDMPKLQSPFVSEKTSAGYCVTPQIAEGYEWVFDNEDVTAVEKVDGTNVSVLIENGVVTNIWNRTTRIPFFNHGKRNIIEGVLNSYDRGYLDMLTDGQWFGELIGPKVNGNPYLLDEPLWIPFETYSHKTLRYHSWGKYPKTFESISEWFKDLESIFMARRGFKGEQAEGVIFEHPDGRKAKLRKDMFIDFEGRRH